jgi:hypothetical protein
MERMMAVDNRPSLRIDSAPETQRCIGKEELSRGGAIDNGPALKPHCWMFEVRPKGIIMPDGRRAEFTGISVLADFYARLLILLIPSSPRYTQVNHVVSA